MVVYVIKSNQTTQRNSTIKSAVDNIHNSVMYTRTAGQNYLNFISSLTVQISSFQYIKIYLFLKHPLFLHRIDFLIVIVHVITYTHDRIPERCTCILEVFLNHICMIGIKKI